MTPAQIQQAVSGSQPASTQPPPDRGAAVACSVLLFLVLVQAIHWIIRHNPAFNRNPAAPSQEITRSTPANSGSRLP
jgi:hypothetical protein